MGFLGNVLGSTGDEPAETIPSTLSMVNYAARAAIYIPADTLFCSFCTFVLLAKSNLSNVALDDAERFLSGLLVFILCDLCTVADLDLSVTSDAFCLTCVCSSFSSSSSSSSSSM